LCGVGTSILLIVLPTLVGDRWLPGGN
jgi:hypothetical protein